MTTTLCLSGAVFHKAGKNYSLSGAAFVDEFINQAECFVNVSTRTNWIDAYSGLNADVKLILEEICSNLSAIYLIQYDMSRYSTRQEALIMVNVLWARIQEGIRLLNEEKNRTFIQEA